MTTLPTVSVCMIVRDEAHNLPSALASVSGLADEVVVVDTGSLDDSVEVARRFGAKVRQVPWADDFSAARNASLAEARMDWVLVLDADETVRAEAAPQLKALLANVVLQDGVFVGLRNVDGTGQVLSAARVLRLVRNHRRYRFHGRVHESLAPSIEAARGRLLMTELCLLDHHGYVEAESKRKGRRARNLALLEAALRDAPDDASALHHLAVEHCIGGRPREAEPLLRRVLALAPDTTLAAPTAAYLAQLLFEQGRFAEVRDVVQPYLNAPGHAADCVFLDAAAALECGDAGHALAAAERLSLGALGQGVLFRSPRQAQTLRARSLERLGRGHQALEAWETLLHAAPQDAFVAGQWARLLGELEGVPGLQRRGLSGVKSAEVAVAVLSRLMALGEVTTSLELAERLAVNPRFEPFLGQMRMAAGDFAGAAALFRRALSGSAHLLGLCGWFANQPTWVAEALTVLGDVERQALEALVLPAPASPAATAMLRRWAEQLSAMGAPGLGASLGAAPPGGLAATAAHARTAELS